MLRKLYKHEFYSLLRTLVPVYIALIALAGVSRLSFLLPEDLALSNVVTSFSILLYVLGAIGIFVLAVVMIIVRFYGNLLSRQGYLTFSLPFKARQHINCKLVVGVCVMILNVLVLLLSLTLFTIGTNFWGMFFDFIRESFRVLEKTAGGIGYTTVILVMTLVLLIIASFEKLLMFYTSMAIGQQFKNRIGGSIIAYICIYAALQFIGLLATIPLSVTLFDSTNALLESSNGFGIIILFLSILIVWEAVLSTAFYLTTNHFMTKKLNLE